MASPINTTRRNALTRFINVATPATGTVVTGVAFSVNLTADVPVNWAIHGGADAARFALAGNTLSMTAKTFASPVDANADNVYEVTLRATELWNGFSKLHDYRVTVTAA